MVIRQSREFWILIHNGPCLGWPLAFALEEVRAFSKTSLSVSVIMLNSHDLQDLNVRGIAPSEAEQQLGLFRSPPASARLERPAVVGDGILRLSEADQSKYERLGLELLSQGRVTKMVPASGAATRMFKDFLAAQESSDGVLSGAVAEAFARVEQFAFFEAWKRAVGVDSNPAFATLLVSDHWRDALEALLQAPGLDYANRPKALLAFHRVKGQVRTALEEQLREGLELGTCHAHFTVSAEHRRGFEAQLTALSLPLNTSLSEQSPSKDTLAAEADGSPFRDAQGRLVFRPGGHGALLHNLQALVAGGHSQVILKNIDNIAHPKLWPVALRWKRILLGLLHELGPLDRPVRVAGVVPNTGEPGGGPFWVDGRLQIVESAQVNLKDPGQKALFNASTHFNPVDLACRLTDAHDRPFDLTEFRDPKAVFLAQKSHGGRPLQALELPGLWNGAMAYWKTVFVEVPLETFNPVKTVNDLLKPAHQP